MTTPVDRTSAEYQKSFRAALTWTRGDEAAAHDLVKSWSRAADEYEQGVQADYAHEAGKHRNRYVEICPQCSGRVLR